MVWIVLAVLFGIGVTIWGGGQAGGEFFAGFIMEKSLSVDNLFVFILIMAKFSVPSHLQQRVLLFGVLIALFLRAIFIAADAAIIASFSWVFYLFGAFLIYTAWKLVKEPLSSSARRDALSRSDLQRCTGSSLLEPQDERGSRRPCRTRTTGTRTAC